VDLKKTYSAREVAALTGLTARQLEWWDHHGVLSPAIAPQRTASGGYTERRYSPMDLLELSALGHLRRQGFTVGQLRQLLSALRDRFGIRLFDALDSDGAVTLLTEGRELYAKTAAGTYFNLLRDPEQPLLMVNRVTGLREVTARVRSRKPARKKSTS
jgi:DNA-binding transcriptional MerR regulator